MVSKFNLSFVLSKQQNGTIMFNLIYDKRLFLDSTASAFQRDYLLLLEQILANPVSKIGHLRIEGLGEVDDEAGDNNEQIAGF
jgi:hypothetical protein